MILKHIIRKKRFNNTGIALGGGAALGLAHIGVLRAMEEFHIQPKIISGNSAGALVGGMYAMGMSVDEMEETVLRLGENGLSGMFKMTLKSGGMVSDRQIYDLIYDLTGDARIENCRIPFIAVAVDVISGNTVYITRGKMADALRASISVPGVFRPLQYKKMLLVDGGIRDTVPLRALDSFKPTTRIGVVILKTSIRNEYPQVIDIDLESEYKNSEIKRIKVPGVFKLLSRTMSLTTTESAFKEVNASKPDLSIYINVSDMIKMWDFDKGHKVIRAGYEQAVISINKYLGSKK